MNVTILKIKNLNDHSFEALLASRENGGRFVVYEYLIPRPFFAPVKLISDVYYLAPGESSSKYAFRYNLINLFWGWWGLPFGPSYTYTAIRKNKSGIDFTDDVFDNLTHADFEDRMVIIKKLHSVFIHPDKAVLKEMAKGFKRFSSKVSALASIPVVGKFIDTENPYYVIGLSDNDYEKKDEIEQCLRKYFYAHTRFEFVKISAKDELTEKLMKQGIQINATT